MECIWWKQISKASHFIDHIIETALSEKHILLSMPEFVPWHDTMYEIIEEKLHAENPTKKLDQFNCPNKEPGQYLLERYCEVEKQASYRYGMSYAEFLAKSSEITLNNCYIWVKDVSLEQLEAWTSFVADYSKHASYGNCAIFVLETSEQYAKGKSVKQLEKIIFSDTIEAYDKFMFCALASMDFSIKPYIRAYFVDMVSTICSNDIELCAECIHNWSDFLKDPVKVLTWVCENKSRSDGSSFTLDLNAESIDKLIWECQLKNLFPLIPKFLAKFIQQHFDVLCHALQENPTFVNEQEFGEKFENPQDLEIGPLVKLVKSSYIAIDPREKEELELFRTLRNKLAHLETLDYDMVEKILSIRI